MTAENMSAERRRAAGRPANAAGRSANGAAKSMNASSRSTKKATGVDVTRHLTYKLVALTNSLSRSAARDFAAEIDLTVPEWRVLATLGSRGEMSLAALTRVLAVDKGWISRVVVRLEARGLVSRTPDPADERLFVLALTRAGAELHLKGSAVSTLRQKNLEAALSKPELALLNTALEKLLTCAEQMETQPIGGVSK